MNVNAISIKPTNKYEVQKLMDDMILKNRGLNKINSKTLEIISYITDTFSHIFKHTQSNLA